MEDFVQNGDEAKADDEGEVKQDNSEEYLDNAAKGLLFLDHLLNPVVAD